MERCRRSRPRTSEWVGTRCVGMDKNGLKGFLLHDWWNNRSAGTPHSHLETNISSLLPVWWTWAGWSFFLMLKLPGGTSPLEQGVTRDNAGIWGLMSQEIHVINLLHPSTRDPGAILNSDTVCVLLWFPPTSQRRCALRIVSDLSGRPLWLFGYSGQLAITETKDQATSWQENGQTTYRQIFRLMGSTSSLFFAKCTMFTQLTGFE